MFPSPQKSYMGIYVKNQYNKLCELMPNDNIRIYHMQRRITNVIGSITKYAKSFLFFTPFLFRSFNVIHVHFFYPMVLLGFVYKILWPETKLVITFHGTDLRKHIQSSFNKKFYGTVIRSADFVIAVGNDLAKELEEKLHRKTDAILSAGVDERVFFYLPEMEKKYDYIFVGTFIKTKGIDIYLAAIRKLGKRNLKFCFVGTGEYLNDIQALKGYSVDLFENLSQDKIRVLYNQSRFLVLPSRNEAFGLVVTEAMFCGLPAIVSGAGGLKDQVIHNFNGYLLEKNTEEYLAERIISTLQLSTEDYQTLVRNALNSNRRHQLSTVCEELKTIYTTVLNEK
jgi:L-malate glycosyltransferase